MKKATKTHETKTRRLKLIRDAEQTEQVELIIYNSVKGNQVSYLEDITEMPLKGERARHPHGSPQDKTRRKATCLKSLKIGQKEDETRAMSHLNIPTLFHCAGSFWRSEI